MYPLMINYHWHCCINFQFSARLTFFVIIFDSIANSTFPSLKIKPILKKNGLDKNNLNNYRPISQLPVFYKLLERVVSQQIIKHIERHSLLHPNQVYVPHKSTETALTRINNDVIIFLNWLKSYITDRSCYVSIGKMKSKKIHLDYGVLQW